MAGILPARANKDERPDPPRSAAASRRAAGQPAHMVPQRAPGHSGMGKARSPISGVHAYDRKSEIGKSSLCRMLSDVKNCRDLTNSRCGTLSC
jgi:hypothetical protein